MKFPITSAEEGDRKRFPPRVSEASWDALKSRPDRLPSPSIFTLVSLSCIFVIRNDDISAVSDGRVRLVCV